MEVGIRELKLRLSRYLDQVRHGEVVVVTDRGRPVARLEPIDSVVPPAAVTHLVESGRLIYKPPPRDLRDLPLPIRLLPGDKTSLDYVREQRR